MYDFVIKSPEGRIVVVASRQKFKYIQKGYVYIGKLDMSDEDVKDMIKKGHTKEEVFAEAIGNRMKLEKRMKNGREHFFVI